jgi:hypothetical protein
VAEARGQFENKEESERPPLEAVSLFLVKTQLTEDLLRVILNCNLCRSKNCYCYL